MKKAVSRIGFIFLFAALITGFAAAQSATGKTLQGKVLSSNDSPLTGAIVYLQDGRTNSIRSFISTDNGSYRFGQLASDVDYQVWAQYKGEKSGTKTISSYDSRKKVVIDFRIKTK
jgi:hypothetical protein